MNRATNAEVEGEVRPVNMFKPPSKFENYWPFESGTYIVVFSVACFYFQFQRCLNLICVKVI